MTAFCIKCNTRLEWVNWYFGRIDWKKSLGKDQKGQ